MKTSERLAQELGENEKTVRRAAKYKKAVDTIEDLTSTEVKQDILAGETPITKKDAMRIASIANGNGGKKQEPDPERAKAILDEVLAGNAKTVKQAMAYSNRQCKVKEAQSLPDGTYNVIYADPPWQYSNSGSEGSADSHYPTMPTEDICTLLTDIGVYIVDNSVLFMWVTNPLLEDGLQVVRSWGFKYKTNIVWDKPQVNRGKSGFYVQGHHEILLIATKGSCLPVWLPSSRGELSPGEHSAKPDAFRDIIERMYPDYNYLELFARNQPPRDNWEFWGNEA
jgi:N6-adenosine-specific RNA methylase IME4